LPKTTLRLSDSEGKVLSILFEKLEEIKNALHSDKVFDVICEVVYGKNLAQLLLDALEDTTHTTSIKIQYNCYLL